MASSSAAPTLELGRWLPYRMFVVAGRVAELLESFYGPRWGLGLPAWRILAVVADRPGVSAREIARACGLDAVAVSRGIAQLVALGFARREAGAQDRRYASVTLTPEGEAAFTEIATLARAIEARLLAALPEAEQAALDRALDRLDTASGKLVGAGWRALLAEAAEAGEAGR